MTLNEMLIVLILSSIVMGLAFSVLSMVQRHMFSIQKNIANNTRRIQLEQSLWIDFNTYNSVKYKAESNKLIFKSELDSTTYQFDSNVILKNRDTFHIAVKKKAFYFNGFISKGNKIDALKLTLGIEHQDKSIFIFKTNDASQFMN